MNLNVREWLFGCLLGNPAFVSRYKNLDELKTATQKLVDDLIAEGNMTEADLLISNQSANDEFKLDSPQVPEWKNPVCKTMPAVPQVLQKLLPNSDFETSVSSSRKQTQIYDKIIPDPNRIKLNPLVDPRAKHGMENTRYSNEEIESR